uniref:Uncharacterized protein n=1 Tax=Bubo bubo TaxID=30461 RepID=A0A8C0EXV2_BUBBB
SHHRLSVWLHSDCLLGQLCQWGIPEVQQPHRCPPADPLWDFATCRRSCWTSQSSGLTQHCHPCVEMIFNSANIPSPYMPASNQGGQ